MLSICYNVNLRKWCAHLTGQSHAVAHKGGDRKVAIMNWYAWDGPGTLRSWVKMVGGETTLVPCCCVCPGQPEILGSMPG